MNRTIARMTLPTVLSNISVPLLGLCDTAVAGHMGEEKYLAGIAIGSVMMSGVYWLFSFLRGGTSGLTASAYGAADRDRMGQILLRSVLMGVLIGLLLMAVARPVRNILLGVMGASAGVSDLASYYFSVCIAGAVPMMVLTAVTGWLVGMQSTGKAMLLNVGMSLLNVVATLTFVYVLGYGFKGIAMGTLTAQWLTMLPAAVMAVGMCGKHGIRVRSGWWRSVVFSDGWRQIFSVNSNLFFRSACLIAATVLLYACAARMGDVATGANAVINQMFLFFSFFMDGLAYTGEALVGRYNGASDFRNLRLSVVELLKWSLCVTLVFVALYGFGLPLIVSLLTDSADVAASVVDCKVWVMAIPAAGAAAFIYDGFFIGLTKTRPMLISTLCGVALFVILIVSVPKTQWMLWMAFTSYLALRSILLISLFPIKIINLNTRK